MCVCKLFNTNTNTRSFSHQLQINQNVCFVGSLEIRFDFLGVFLYLLYSMYCIWFMYIIIIYVILDKPSKCGLSLKTRLAN